MTDRMLTLVRREFWEHRSLWIVPPVLVALLYVLPGLFGDVSFGESGAPSPERAQAIVAAASLALAGLVLLVMSVVLVFYLLDCLYAERKDRSILFWKSLPVSDAQTVVAKLLVALVVVPIGTWLLCVCGDVIARGAISLRSGSRGVTAAFPLWETGTWFRLQAVMLYALVVSLAWYAPIAAYLLAISAWARRSVTLWAALPPALLLIVERVTFGTRHVADFVEARFKGPLAAAFGGMNLDPDQAAVVIDRQQVLGPARLFERIDPTPVLSSPGLWLGLLAAAALAWLAIRIRRYRDDT